MARLTIIDDDTAIHALLKVFFEDLGHQVNCFENLSEVLAYLDDHAGEIDLIVSDLRLPDGTGLELMPVLQKRQLDIPLILITAYGSSEIAANSVRPLNSRS